MKSIVKCFVLGLAVVTETWYNNFIEKTAALCGGGENRSLPVRNKSRLQRQAGVSNIAGGQNDEHERKNAHRRLVSSK